MGYEIEAYFFYNVIIMIVYKRKIKKRDIQNLENDETLLYYYSNNIAYVLRKLDNNYIIRKKKVFNNQLVDEKIVKTIEQCIKVVE